MIKLKDGRADLYQWDTKRILSVPEECSKVHFSNKHFGRSVDVDVVKGEVEIPDFLLQVAKPLCVWGFVGTPENGYTKISKIFNVIERNKPADYVFTPTDQMTLQEIKDIAQSVRDDADNGVFDGVSATHKWDGTTLTVTSASGSSSADLQGEKGEPGKDYVLTDDDKSEIAELSSKLIAKPDWNAAEGEAGHVLNRTHWSGLEFVEYKREETLTFPADGDNGILDGSYRYREIDYDAKFRVTWDGVPYELYGAKTDSALNLGNEAVRGGSPDTGEPFFIQINKEMGMAFIYTANKKDGVEATHTYRLEMEKMVWHKLDSNYLPDNVINEIPDWKAEDGEVGYIRNRSHWVEFGDNEIDVIPETAVDLREQSTGGLSGFVSGDEFISGDKYFVYWNGTRYESVGVQHGQDAYGNPAVYIGNLAKYTGVGDTGEPFLLTCVMKGKIIAVEPMDGTTELTLKVTAANKIYHKLPAEFLPDNIGVQGNWEQNDPAQPDYIKGRTHWVEGGGKVEILPECKPTYNAEDEWFEIQNSPLLEAGKTYIVRWNGVEYTCIGFDGATIGEAGAGALGDFYTASGGQVGDAPTGEPFIIVAGNRDDGNGNAIPFMVIGPLDGTTDLTLSIYEGREIVHKLPEEFLPDSVVTRTEFEAALGSYITDVAALVGGDA